MSAADTDKAVLPLPVLVTATGAHQDELTSVVTGGSAIILTGLAIKYIIYN